MNSVLPVFAAAACILTTIGLVMTMGSAVRRQSMATGLRIVAIGGVASIFILTAGLMMDARPSVAILLAFGAEIVTLVLVTRARVPSWDG
jgi:branched-subunit amino acid permease